MKSFHKLKKLTKNILMVF